MTENQWHRLHRLVEARRTTLDLTLAALQAQGGPSPKWVQNLLAQEGEPSPRQRAKLAALDRVLQWDVGTSWDLVSKDRSEWSLDLLQDEERQLVEDQHDKVDAFTYALNFRLRALPEDERDRIMQAILVMVGYAPDIRNGSRLGQGSRR